MRRTSSRIPSDNTENALEKCEALAMNASVASAPEPATKMAGTFS